MAATVTDKLAYEALKRYFNILREFGYKCYWSVDKLLLLLFITELLNSDCSSFLTEDDRRMIYNVLSCLYGSTCLIDYPDSGRATSLKCP
jgi:hypothetical protein